jgi:hypothetical protein
MGFLVKKSKKLPDPQVSYMRNTAPLAYTAVPTGVTVSVVTFVGISGHVAGTLTVTFAGTSVTIPESPVTLDRNTQ